MHNVRYFASRLALSTPARDSIEGAITTRNAAPSAHASVSHVLLQLTTLYLSTPLLQWSSFGVGQCISCLTLQLWRLKGWSRCVPVVDVHVTYSAAHAPCLCAVRLSCATTLTTLFTTSQCVAAKASSTHLRSHLVAALKWANDCTAKQTN
jgi:hypothetical protein